MDRAFYRAARTFPVHAGMGLFFADSGKQVLAGFLGEGELVFSEQPVTDRRLLAALVAAEAPAEAPAEAQPADESDQAPAETPAEAPAETPPAAGKKSKKAAE